MVESCFLRGSIGFSKVFFDLGYKFYCGFYFGIKFGKFLDVSLGFDRFLLESFLKNIISLGFLWFVDSTQEPFEAFLEEITQEVH